MTILWILNVDIHIMYLSFFNYSRKLHKKFPLKSKSFDASWCWSNPKPSQRLYSTKKPEFVVVVLCFLEWISHKSHVNSCFCCHKSMGWMDWISRYSVLHSIYMKITGYYVIHTASKAFQTIISLRLVAVSNEQVFIQRVGPRCMLITWFVQYT